MSETIGHKRVLARKEHTCHWYYQKIDIGSYYDRQAIVSDGDISTWKNHIHCLSIAQQLDMWAETYGEGLSSEDFRENIYVVWENNNNGKRPPFQEAIDFVLKQHNII